MPTTLLRPDDECELLSQSLSLSLSLCQRAMATLLKCSLLFSPFLLSSLSHSAGELWPFLPKKYFVSTLTTKLPSFYHTTGCAKRHWRLLRPIKKKKKKKVEAKRRRRIKINKNGCTHFRLPIFISRSELSAAAAAHFLTSIHHSSIARTLLFRKKKKTTTTMRKKQEERIRFSAVQQNRADSSSYDSCCTFRFPLSLSLKAPLKNDHFLFIPLRLSSFFWFFFFIAPSSQPAIHRPSI